MKTVLLAAALLASLGLLGIRGTEAEPDARSGEGSWERLADTPKDLADRECPPGMDGAWVYVPDWKGFLLYGGCSPTLSNEGWFFDPDKREWSLLWAHDSLARDGKAWKVLLPRDLVWSTDRPGPARGFGAVTDGKSVFLLGGHPAPAWRGDGRHQRSDFLGPTRLGAWVLNGAGQFRHLGDDGPAGATRAVYDKARHRIITAPQGGDATAPFWVLPLAGGTWEPRTAPVARPGHHVGWAYDAKAKKGVLFTRAGETWTLDAATDSWKDMKPSGAPPGRHHAALCFDEASGLTVLHGGVASKGKDAGSAFEPAVGGSCFGDTWVYDAGKNEWKEIKAPGSPPATFSGRDLIAYDPDRKTCVLYDPSAGVYAFKTRSSGKSPGSRSAPLPAPRFRTVPKSRALDPQVQAWQAKVRGLADNSWTEPGVQTPVLGCMNITYDPKNRCIPQMGGCGGPMFQTGDDYGYHNQIWLFDMDAGRYYLRRAHHAWGPPTKEFLDLRVGAGCTRGACFDSARGVVWAVGGNGTPLLKGSRSIRSYDVAADRLTPAGPGSPRGSDGQSDQLVYDVRHDAVVMVDVRVRKRTFLYYPKSDSWVDGGPCPAVDHPDLFGYANRAYDPQVGTIMVFAQGGNMKTLAYDAGTKQWKDLAPKGNEKLPLCDLPGIAYDALNRAVLFVRSNHTDTSTGGPEPYGTLRILDLASNTWKEGPTSPVREKLNAGSMTYDVNHNLVICSFGFRGRFLFYRYKGGCPPNAFPEGNP